jgi:hypothetical protein
MGTVAEFAQKVQVGEEHRVASAGASAKDLEAFATVIDEARRLQATGKIRIIEEQPNHVRFVRLR